jgi:hypothetical protein
VKIKKLAKYPNRWSAVSAVSIWKLELRNVQRHKERGKASIRILGRVKLGTKCIPVIPAIQEEEVGDL